MQLSFAAQLHSPYSVFRIPYSEVLSPQSVVRRQESGGDIARPTDSEPDSVTDWFVLACGFSY